MAKPSSFFLRFYGVPQSNIDQCLKELAAHATWVRHEQGPLRLSVNFAVPNTTQDKVNAEVRLYFKTSAEALALRCNQTTQQIYMKYATPTKAKFEMREPGQAAFKV